MPVERLIEAKVFEVCTDEQIDYRGLEPIQRLFLTHYRCPVCKILPLYFLDLRIQSVYAAANVATLSAFGETESVEGSVRRLRSD